MRVLLRFVARLLGATLVTTVVLISLTATAAAARAHGALADGRALSRPAVAELTLTGRSGTVYITSVADQEPAPRLQPAVEHQPTPWTVVAWLAAGMVLVVAAGVMLTVVGRLRAVRVGRSGTSR